MKNGISIEEIGTMCKVLFIEGKREGYSLSGCVETLTVGELINILSEYDADCPVYLRNDSGYTYGSIGEEAITLVDRSKEGA